MNIRLVDTIYIHYTLSVVIIEDKRPIAIHCNWVGLCIHGHLKCEIDFGPYSKQSLPKWCVLRFISYRRCRSMSSKVKPSS